MARRLRVLFLIDRLGRGGTERQLVLLLQHLDRERFEPEVFAIRGGGVAAEEIRGLGIPVEAHRRRGAWDLPIVFARVVRRALARRPDVVFGYHALPGLAGLLAGRLAGARRILVSVRSSDHFLQPRPVRTLRSCVYAAADCVLTNFPDPGFLGRGRSHYIPNGVSIPDRPTPWPQAPPIRFLIVARLFPQKRVDLAIAGFARAVDAIERESGPVELLIAGEGPLRSALEAQAGATGLGERVRFLGEVSSIADWLAGAHLLVLLSSFEGMPNVVLEALAYGRPVMATAVDAVADVVRDQVTGLLLGPAPSPEQVAERLAWSARNLDRLREMGEAGSRRVAEFSVASMVRRHEGVLAGVEGVIRRGGLFPPDNPSPPSA